MAHAVSASYFRSDQMSPQALALAFLLHALTALALWWMSMHPPTFPTESTIDVTMEQFKPPEQALQPIPQPAPPPPPPAPPAQATPPSPQAPGLRLGMPPPAPPSTETPKQQPSPPEPPKPEPQQAATPQPPAQPPPPPLDQVVPPSAPPPAPPTALDYPKPALPPPAPHPAAPKAPQPPQRTQTPPPQQALRPSPLSQGQHEGATPAPHAAAPPTFQNPADTVARSRALDAYFWQVVRKFSQYLPDLREKNEGGTVVIRLVIGRDGRLIDSGIARSSGVMALDRGMLEAVRHAAPYPPLPSEVPGDSVVFTQPITAKR